VPDAQAAISAIRAIDAFTPIVVDGYNFSTAYRWPWENWEYTTLTGGNLLSSAHQYFDGTITNTAGSIATTGMSGVYSGVYSSYSNSSTFGITAITPYVSWLQTTGQKGYVGEFNVPSAASCTACTIAASLLTVGGTLTGTWDVGQSVTGASVTAGTTITSLGTGTGGAGTYHLSASSTVGAGESMAAAITLSSPWYALQGNFLQYLAAYPQVTGTIWEYGSNGSSLGALNNISPVGGVIDPRLLQMQQYR
jgi:hypothetical protein